MDEKKYFFNVRVFFELEMGSKLHIYSVEYLKTYKASLLIYQFTKQVRQNQIIRKFAPP